MRLIDVDNLDFTFDRRCFSEGDTQYARGVDDAIEVIHNAPTISAVPVVRCKNCKHFNLQTHECENELLSTDHEGGASYSLNFYDDDFCSYGEWREADHEVSEL